jgi:hypothetical protein
MDHFLLGVLAMGYSTAAVFFARFWRESADKFFLWFAVAFGILALNQVLLLALGERTEHSSALYLVRLSAFCIILIAIWDKNRGRA